MTQRFPDGTTVLISGKPYTYYGSKSDTPEQLYLAGDDEFPLLEIVDGVVQGVITKLKVMPADGLKTE